MRRRALDIEAIMENLCRTQFGFLIEQQYHELGGLNATVGVVPISRFKSRQRFETHNVDQRSPLLKNYHRRGPCILQYILRDDFVVDGLGTYHGLRPPTVHRGRIIAHAIAGVAYKFENGFACSEALNSYGINFGYWGFCKIANTPLEAAYIIHIS
ncbi:hypothetical protein Ancab_001295 [Ancistrocladus abbreviatus]